MIGVVVEADNDFLGAQEAAEANDPSVGEGTPATAPEHDLATELPLLDQQPVRLAGVAQGLAGAGAMLAFGGRVRVALPLAVGLYALSEVAARRVTPLARPRDAQGGPLTP
jgi:hypothetical protein